MRELAAIIGDELSADACLASYLDQDDHITVHGTADPCDQPRTGHRTRPIRRFEQGWPGDFDRAVIAYGRFSQSPYSIDGPKSRQSITFQVSILVRETVADLVGEPVPGDLWAMDIYQMVLRILSLQDTKQPCTSDVFIGHRQHEGDVVELSYDEELRAWRIVTRFRWAVVLRGIETPLAICCPQ